MVKKNDLYVLTSPLSVECHWHRAPAQSRRKWRQPYTHPEVRIWVSTVKPGCKARNIDYAVCIALQDAGISVSTLERIPCQKRSKRGKSTTQFGEQLTLL